MSVIQVDFMKSRESAWQRYTRQVIRKSKRDVLTKSERDILMFLVNLWFHHKGGQKRYIHAGKPKIAKRADCSERTVATALAKFRDIGLIEAVGYISGGTGKATQYTVDIDAIIALLDPHGVKTLDGSLIEFPTAQNSIVNETNCMVCGNENCMVKGCKNCTLSIDTFQGEKTPSQEVEHD